MLPFAARPAAVNVRMSVRRQCSKHHSMNARANALSRIVPQIADAAEACLEEECSLDTVDDLLRELKSKSQTASGKEKAKVLEMYSQLKIMSSPTDGSINKNEVEKLVGAISRTFGTVEAFEFPGPAVGYSMPPTRAVRADKALD